MVLIAIFFDLLPIIFIFISIALIAYALSDGIGEDIVDLAQSGNFITEWKNKAEIAAQAAAGATASLAVLIFLGPALYTIGSFISVFFGYIFFTVWFFMKGVNIWSFDSTERVGVNLLAGIIELIPMINILPGITVMVWRHVKISQKEDRVKNTEQAKKIQGKLNAFVQNTV